MPRSSVRVAAYARVSTEAQAKQQTIDSQVEAIRHYVATEKVVLDDQLLFADNGYSGEVLQRPALERLRDQVASGTIDRLYVHSPDRLARRYAYQVLLIDEFRRAGVEVVFVNHEVDRTPEGELLLQVQGVIAEYERTKILERSRRGKRQAARRGDVSVFSRAPYGYRYIDKQAGGGKARFDVVAEEAAVVRRIFRSFVRDRLPISAICWQLHEDGIRTQTGKEAWCPSMIWNVLRNEAYAGQHHYGRTKGGPRRPRIRPFKGQVEHPRNPQSRYGVPAEEQIGVPVPALIDKEEFALAQVQLDENRRRSRTGRQGARHLLQGLLVCQQCGRSLVHHGSGGKRHTGRTASGEIAPYYYYRCTGLDSHRWGGERLCSSRAVRADYLEKTVWEEVRDLIEQPARIRQEYERRLEEVRTGRKRSDQQVDRLLQKVQQCVGRLIDAYQEGLLDKSEFEPRLRQARERLHALEAEKIEGERGRTLEENYQAVLEHFQIFASTVRKHLHSADLATRMKLVRLLVKHIEVDQAEIRIVYKVGQLPFDVGPATGVLQDHSGGVCPVVQAPGRGDLRLARGGPSPPASRRPRPTVAPRRTGHAPRWPRCDTRSATAALPATHAHARLNARCTGQ